ncbi:acyl carrier protein [Paenibacillus sp. LPE1-1-1.1]|uniref:acyl carrier protein n=1 Tax=Paenibacillus sp. LPE1-1-1.1 TaxID=3135230 RepID=UPI00343FAFF1
MSVDLDNILKEIIIRHSLIEVYHLEIHDDSDLINEFGLDSMSIVNIFVDIESELKIEIRVEEFREPVMNQFSALKRHVSGKLAQKIYQ